MQLRLALRVEPEEALRVLSWAGAAGVDLLFVECELSSEAAIFPTCAAVASRIRQLSPQGGPGEAPRMGVMAHLHLPLHQAIRVAEDAATLDGLADGRAELGLAWAQSESACSPCLHAELEEEVELLRQAWGMETLEHPGPHHQIPPLEVHPKPAQPGGPPIWLETPVGEANRAAALRSGWIGREPAGVRRYLETWQDATSPRVALRPPGEGGRPAFEVAEASREGVTAARDRLRGQIELLEPADWRGAPIAWLGIIAPP